MKQPRHCFRTAPSRSRLSHSFRAATVRERLDGLFHDALSLDYFLNNRFNMPYSAPGSANISSLEPSRKLAASRLAWPNTA